MLTALFALLTISAAPILTDDEPSAADHLAIVKAAAPALVRVEITFQHDKGEPPHGAAGLRRCATCGQFHTSTDAEDLVKQERPMTAGGFLIAPRRVVTTDLYVQSRFIKSIAVRFGGRSVNATVAAYARDQNAMFLDLAEPLGDARPLVFDKSPPPPYFVVGYAEQNGVWTTSVGGVGTAVTATDDGMRFVSLRTPGLITDKAGKAVALRMAEELPVDDTWKGGPESWPVVAGEEMKSRLDAIAKQADACILRVSMTFRSPRTGSGADAMSRFSEDDAGGEESQERNVSGLLVDPSRVLIFSELEPKLTARLERILVHTTDGKEVAAKFAHSLKDYGALVATLDKPLPGPAMLSSKDIRSFANLLLLTADLRIQGKNRTAYFSHGRMRTFDTRWQGRVFPNTSDEPNADFFFDLEGAVVAVNVERRARVTERERWDTTPPEATPSAYVQAILSGLPEGADPSNVPLTEEAENRLAWLGVEMQPLDRELARANKVSDLTGDGQTGALVSYVYPDSPAAKAGIETGSILFRAHVEGEPKPLEVQLTGDRFSGGFPWDKLDQLPEEYYDRIPTPWPSAENAFSRALTDLGFGKSYSAEFFQDGKAMTKQFHIEQSPPHYGSAPRYKSEPLGLTVRDLTYEVRRYFQKEPGDPGVIAAKIEPGGKASVAGVKPFEIVTHVNNEPVKSVKDFERLIAGEKELRLSVNRMARGRIVKIKMTSKSSSSKKAKDEPAASKPADAG